MIFAACASIALTANTLADETSPSASEGLDTITVFGSRAKDRSVFDSAVPIDVFSSDDLVYFTMVARHLEVLFTNTSLIADLATATRNLQELFDHMRQAIVAFDASGSVVRIASREARFLFQRERLEDCSVRDLLYPGAPAYDVDAASFEEWVDLVMNASVENWAKYEAYAPRDVVIERDGQHTVLALEFRPLVRDARIHQLMLLATDVTIERRLESVLRLQKAEHAARVAAMRRLIAGGPQVFLTFVDSARARFDRCDAIVRDVGVLNNGDDLLPGSTLFDYLVDALPHRDREGLAQAARDIFLPLLVE